MPCPFALVVKNGIKIFCRSAGAMPGPLSRTLITTLPFSFFALTKTCPSGIASTALRMRLSSASRSIRSSARTNSDSATSTSNFTGSSSVQSRTSSDNETSSNCNGCGRAKLRNAVTMPERFRTSSVQSRPQPLQLEEVSLSELVRDCTDELPVKFEVDVAETLFVRADERMLRLALLNLMRNAVEAIPDGQVFVSAKNENGSVVIRVRDNGPGIAPADLQKIFIPFFTTKAKGHGIGLALTHRIITQHGGTLSAANTPDGGAMFTIKLAADHAD